MSKALVRMEGIRANKLPLSSACGSYSSKALSILGYVAKLIPPSPSFKSAEVRMASKISGHPFF